MIEFLDVDIVLKIVPICLECRRGIINFLISDNKIPEDSIYVEMSDGCSLCRECRKALTLNREDVIEMKKTYGKDLIEEMRKGLDGDVVENRIKESCEKCRHTPDEDVTSRTSCFMTGDIDVGRVFRCMLHPSLRNAFKLKPSSTLKERAKEAFECLKNHNYEVYDALVKKELQHIENYLKGDESK